MRIGLWGGACLSAALVLLAGHCWAADAPSPLPSNSLWPQSISDLPADPNVHFGTLSNGMRYAVLKNATPPGEVSFRLRVGVGSIEENEAQRGLAHFLEHMAFRGSTHVPEGEVFRRMERLGAALGADTNASTGPTQTVYKFDVPHADGDSVDTALDLMRETASELLISQDAVASERNVVLSEERLGDTPNRRAAKDQLAFLFKDQPLGDHLTIGDVEVIQKATADDLRVFYDSWYRPERTTLIVVGDIDPAMIEDKIKDKFSDWQGRGLAGADPRLGPPSDRPFESRTHFEAGAQNQLSIVWNQPFHDGPDDKAYEIEDTLRQLAAAALSQRLQDIAHGPTPPFVGAVAGYHDRARSVTTAYLGAATTTSEGLKAGLAATGQAFRKAATEGFSQDEVDRQAVVFHRAFDAALAGADKRPTPVLAEGLVGKTDAGEVFLHPADSKKLVEEALQGLTADKVNGALRRAFAGAGPLFFASGAETVDGLVPIMTDALNQDAVATQPDTKLESWPYGSFGSAGRVVQQSVVADLGTTLVRFENGVRLTVKPTDFRDDQILVAVSFGHGRAGLSAETPPPLWTISFGGLLNGGLDKASIVDINRLMASRSVQAQFQANDKFFELNGTTRPQDLDAELQLLTAYIAHPGWRPEGFEEARGKIRMILPQLENTPSSVFQRDGEALLHGGDNRWLFPDNASIDRTSPDEMMALLRPVLASSPLEVAVVGNVTVEQAVAAVAVTLGSLPARSELQPIDAKNLIVRLPPGNKEPVRLVHHGRTDQSIAFVAWPAPDSLGDWREVDDLRVLQAVLRQRLFDEFRTRIGGTYSPHVRLISSRIFPGFGYFSAEVETPPDKIAMFHETLGDIVADLRSREVGADEFERARKPLIETTRKAQQTNGYWAANLVRAQSDDRQLDAIRNAVSGLDAVTPTSVRDTARKWLTDEAAWNLVILPDGTAL
ncbi:insulinase family protein [Telmatospirillum sp.]|uniref:M16 family metallopeptidase n=1 Tax=Telmatospirillum sp. TaxID=2079197 RepID=UPI00283EC7B2|nr:insulinase family protein [Telmatospirillum sp.]MDR3437654.1 insulinase family protein [Telmatospirillum sp.]